VDILLLEALIPETRLWLEARHRVDFQPQLAEDPSALRKAVYKTQALLATPRVAVTREFLDFAPRLKAVACMHESLDNIDLEACRDRRIRVIQPASANVRANAEYLLAGLLLLFRRGLGMSLSDERRPDVRLGHELHGIVVGMLGLAPAAHTLALMLAVMGARLIGYDPALRHSAPIWERLGIKPVSLAELMSQSDGVSVQMLYASRYVGFINGTVLENCKPGLAVRAAGAGRRPEGWPHRCLSARRRRARLRRAGFAPAWPEQPLCHAARGGAYPRDSAACQLVCGGPPS